MKSEATMTNTSENLFSGLDMMKEDGIYSNSFTEMESHGYHYVEITIEDVYNKTEIHKTHEIQIPPERGIFPGRQPIVDHAFLNLKMTQNDKLRAL